AASPLDQVYAAGIILNQRFDDFATAQRTAVGGNGFGSLNSIMLEAPFNEGASHFFMSLRTCEVAHVFFRLGKDSSRRLRASHLASNRATHQRLCRGARAVH